MVESTN